MKRYAVLAVFALLLAACDGLIVAPEEGTIVPTGTVTITGEIPSGIALGGTLTVNGIATAVNADRTWSADIPTTTEGTVTVVEVVYTDPSGKVTTDETALVSGPSVAEGAYSPEGVGMRFTNTGLANLGPVINDLAGGAFDISAMLLAQSPLVQQDDAFLGIDITGNAYEAGLGSVNLATTSTDNGVRTDITITDLYVGVDLHLSGIITADCRLEVQIPTTTIGAVFDLEPTPGNESFVDVNLFDTPSVDTGTVDYEFISGICDGDIFLIGDIVNLVAGPQVQTMVAGGFGGQLGDPDGSGPADSPIADAIETALAEISIAGTVGEAVHANLDGPFSLIDETATGIDFRADADFYATTGTGPSDCLPPAGAPDLDATFDVPAAYPTLGDTTPSGSAYGLGLSISASAFNQLLGAMTECGLLNQDITEFDLGTGPLPITSTLLSVIAPAFATLPPGTPMVVRLDPLVSPFLTRNAGPSGEPSELMLADLHIDFIQPTANGDLTWLTLAVDAPMGFDLAFDPVAGALAPTITPPAGSQVAARVLGNNIGADEPAIEALFPGLFPLFAGGLGDTFAAFPLPSFLGLALNVLEVENADGYYVLYANLDPAPATHIANVAVTDLSTADSVVDSAFDANEWRHRIRTSSNATQARVELDSVIAADAWSFADDESMSANAGYRLTFDVVPAAGDTWQVDLNHAINGAHTVIDEALGSAQSRFTTAINGRVRVGGGAWQSFNFDPSVASFSGGGGAYLPFTGANGLVLQGTTAETITVEFSFGLFVLSDSTALAFPPKSGDEVAVRIGANDTIANGVTAGEYPGIGNRNITTDGHVATVVVSTVG